LREGGGIFSWVERKHFRWGGNNFKEKGKKGQYSVFSKGKDSPKKKNYYEERREGSEKKKELRFRPREKGGGSFPEKKDPARPLWWQ